MAKSKQLPRLTPAILADPEKLADAVEVVIRADPDAHGLQREIEIRQRRLGRLLNEEQGNLFFEIDALTAQRWADLAVLVAAWAFTEGRSTTIPKPTAPMVIDNEAVDAFIATVLRSDRLKPVTKRVRRRHDDLRKQLTKRQWRSYMALEEAVNVRVVEESRVIVRAAFASGASAAKKGPRP